jgi:hypothetical protein
MWQYNNTDELCHYGVLGMRWGHRKNRAVQDAHKAYKQSKKEYRKESVKNLKNIFRKSTWLAGAKNIEDYKKSHKGLTNARNKREQAAFKLIDAAGKDAYNKKLAKTGSKTKALKAEQKVYYKGFKQKRYGIGMVGSIADAKKRHGVTNGNTHYYNHIAKVKGKKYANAVEKKYGKRMAKVAIGTAAAIAGSAIVGAYYSNK